MPVEMHINFLAKQAVESHLGREPDSISSESIVEAVARFEAFRAADQGEIRRRNRRVRRARAWEEMINHDDNWFSAIDKSSGKTYW